MTYQRLTAEQRSIRRWRLKRNHLICKLMAENPQLDADEARKIVNCELPFPRVKPTERRKRRSRAQRPVGKNK